jgi:hypothetical protein
MAISMVPINPKCLHKLHTCHTGKSLEDFVTEASMTHQTSVEKK